MPFKTNESRREYMAAKRSNDPEAVAKAAEIKAAWYQANKELILAKAKAKRKVSPPPPRKQVRDPQKQHEYYRKWYEKNQTTIQVERNERNQKATAALEVIAGRSRAAVCEICSGPGDAKTGIYFDHDHVIGPTACSWLAVWPLQSYPRTLQR